MDLLVKELMIPISEYPSVSEGATLGDAITSLEQGHQKLSGKTYKPRAVLVLDANGQVVGKLGMRGALAALEPKYSQIGDLQLLSHFGLNPDFIQNMVEKQELWTDPLDHLCQMAKARKVTDFMVKVDKHNTVSADTRIAKAIHQLVMWNLLSLLVKDGQEIVGILRLGDVFQEVSKRMKVCKV